MTASVVARILLRYVSGVLIAKGLLDTDFGTSLARDPDVLEVLTLVIGTGSAIAAEYWYWLARKFGWSK